MGAKTPTKLKLRRPTYKCDECEQKFLSIQALKSHRYCIHKIKLKPKTKSKLVNLLGKAVKRSSAKKGKDIANHPQVSDLRKIEYECPQCRHRFSVHFSALRHIQKFHCVNSKGEKVPPNSPHLIKPARVEICIKCQMRVRPDEQHSCPKVNVDAVASVDTSTCVCLGCQQVFPTMFVFDLHISGLHSDGVETLFFPNMQIFTMWKEQMEAQGQTKYLMLAKSPRQTYRCTYSTQDEDGVPHFCPSAIVLKEYSKTIQVNFFKEHHGHSCKYKLPDRFNKYLSTVIMRKSLPGFTPVPDEEEDLFLKLRSVIDYVMLTAFNADTETLKLLHSKAVEMEKIMKPDDEEDVKPVKNMTDEQITDTLESLSKRKNSTEPTDVKRTKGDDMRTLVDSSVSKTESNSPITCFNDSYKEFVGQINNRYQRHNVSSDSKLKKLKSNKKRIVKTKIGQFKPAVSPKTEGSPRRDAPICPPSPTGEASPGNLGSPVKELDMSVGLPKIKTEIDYEVIEQEDDCNILILRI